MKKLFALFLCLLGSLSVFAQLEWVSQKGPNLKKFLKTKKNEYIIFHGENNWGSEYLTVLDEFGNVKLQLKGIFKLDEIQIHLFKDIIELEDSSIQILTNISFEDNPGFGLVLDAVYTFKDSFLPPPLFLWSIYYQRVIVLSDGKFVLLRSDDFLQMHDTANSMVIDKWLMNNKVSDLIPKNGDSILVATQEGLLLMDKNLNIIQQHNSFIFNKIKSDKQGRFLGIKSDSIFLLSNNLSVMAKAGHSGNNIKDLWVENGMTAVLADAGHVYRYDSSLSLINTVQILNDGEFQFIAVHNDRFVVAGKAYYGAPAINKGNIAIFVKEYGFDGDALGVNRDIGVVSVAQPQEVIVEPQGNKFLVTFKGIQVTVQNFGDTSVNNFWVSSAGAGQRKITNLGVQPGATVDLVMPDAQRAFNTYPAGAVSNLCYWTAYPDDLMDLDASNDLFCADILVSNKEVVVSEAIKLFPNPASNWLNIQWERQTPFINAKCRITNAAGKVMQERGIDFQQNQILIPLENWPSGMYWIQIFGDRGGAFSGKFLVVK